MASMAAGAMARPRRRGWPWRCGTTSNGRCWPWRWLCDATIQPTEQPLLLQLMFLPFLPLLLQLTDALKFLPLLLQLLTPVPLYHISPQLLPTPLQPQHNRRR